MLDFVNAVTNFRVVFEINGIVAFDRNLGSFGTGEQPIVLLPPPDIRLGDVATFTLSSIDGAVTVKGNMSSGIPYQLATIALWVKEPLALASDEATIYTSDGNLQGQRKVNGLNSNGLNVDVFNSTGVGNWTDRGDVDISDVSVTVRHRTGDGVITTLASN